MYNETSEKPNPGPDVPLDTYPAVVRSEGGHKTLIVQASSYAKYVGDLTVYFDGNGDVVRWEGAPIFLDTNVTKDPAVERALLPFRKIIEAKAREVVGYSRVDLNRDHCYSGECNIGNVFADSHVHYYTMNVSADEGTWTKASIALMSAAGLRTSLTPGGIIRTDLTILVCLGAELTLQNSISAMWLHAFRSRTQSISSSWKGSIWGRFWSWASVFLRLREISRPDICCKPQVESLQFSRGQPSITSIISALNLLGLRAVYNVTKEPFNRVVSVHVLSRNATKPSYQPLSENEVYRIIMPSFQITFGPSIIRENMESHTFVFHTF